MHSESATALETIPRLRDVFRARTRYTLPVLMTRKRKTLQRDDFSRNVLVRFSEILQIFRNNNLGRIQRQKEPGRLGSR